MTPTTRSALTHVGTAAGAGLATALWLATKGVDLYAVIDQFNAVVADVAKLVATVTPIATGAYAVYKATTKQKLLDIAAAPNAVEEARKMPPTPEIKAIARALEAAPTTAGPRAVSE